MKTLTQIQIKKAPDGPLYDGGGLMLQKRGESGKWIYRYSRLGRRREMGLGQWPTVTLAAARQARDEWAVELAKGNDPISVRIAQRAAEAADRDKDDPTMDRMTTLVFEARKAKLRGEGVRGRWRSPLDQHVLPKLGRIRGSELRATDIAEALRPIWRTKHPTAKKALERIRVVQAEGRLMGFPVDPFTADQAKQILGDVLHRARPTPSTPWRDIPDLYQRLPDSPVGDCLRFMILTLVRMHGCVGARTEEIDGDVWTVPADRVKGREGRVDDFRVPLSAEAQRIAQRAMSYAENGFLFPGWTKRPVSSTALEKCLNTMKEAGRPHGFRASFRTWVQDTDACGWDVSETVLGHAIGNKVERSYARSDLLDRRRIVMDAWAAHVTGQKAAQVIPLKR